jgi:MarR family transcriptional regulator, transcriptional regulator for hemolysin
MPTVTTSPRPESQGAAPQSQAAAPQGTAAAPQGNAAAPQTREDIAPSGPPRVQPIGLALSSTAKALNRAFTDELAQAGGSQHVWLILVALKQQRWRAQQEIAAAVGVEGPTLTHHLDRLEKAGLIERARDPKDRRAVRVELTAAGEELFNTLRKTAMSFDRRLRAGIADDDLEAFRRVLAQLRENVAKS